MAVEEVLGKGRRFLHEAGGLTSILSPALQQKGATTALELGSCSALNSHQHQPARKAVKSLKKKGEPLACKHLPHIP